LKIIHIIPSLKTGGAERLALDICIELNNHKSIEVILIVLSEINDFKNESNGIEIKYIPSKVSLSISGKTNVEITKLTSFINDFKPDIIHTHLFEAEIISRWYINEKATYFSHCHDNMIQLSGLSANKSIKKNITDIYEKNIIIKRYLSCENQFIAISNHTKIYFTNVLPKKLTQNIHLLPNSIDYKKFQNNNVKKSPKLRLINVGSFAPKKNQTFLIDILLELKRRGVQCELFLLGEGEQWQKVKEKALINGLKNEIHFLGNVNDVEEQLWKSHLYIHSAYYEPFGLVLLEAMAAGLPVVSLDGKGNRDFIENGINGYILENQDSKLFSDIIMNLVHNKELYGEIAEKGKVTAQRYDIKNYTTKLIDIYNESMSSTN
jgi:glycosyltransferase involved in cell wall biosynthesis